MNPKQFAVLVIVAFTGGIIGGCISNGPALIGPVHAGDTRASGKEKEAAPVMDIRKKYETTQQITGRYAANQCKTIFKLYSTRIEYTTHASISF